MLVQIIYVELTEELVFSGFINCMIFGLIQKVRVGYRGRLGCCLYGFGCFFVRGKILLRCYIKGKQLENREVWIQFFYSFDRSILNIVLGISDIVVNKIEFFIFVEFMVLSYFQIIKFLIIVVLFFCKLLRFLISIKVVNINNVFYKVFILNWEIDREWFYCFFILNISIMGKNVMLLYFVFMKI